MTSKTLITGWNGFFGSILCKAQESFNISLVRCGRVKGSDVTCDLSKAVPQIPDTVDRVIHSAGVTPNASRPHNTKDIFQTGNVTSTKNLLASLNPQNIKSFVLISSASVYGMVSGENILETATLSPTSEYGKSKLEVEKLVIKWCQQNNVPYTIVRLPLVVGPGAPGTLGQLVKAIESKRFVIPGSGDARKSMVLATDVADWITNHPVSYGIFNLTDQTDPSYAELCDAITEHLNFKPVPRIPLTIMMVGSWVGDIAQTLLKRPIPYNSNVHVQLTETLTFSSKAAANHGWSPNSVISNKEVWLK
ncbi:MAG: NAD-dependent epimerase/dehydratase family protein [Granulosicoccus sp.]